MGEVVHADAFKLDRVNPYLGYLVDSRGLGKRLRYKGENGKGGEKHLLTFGSPGSGKSTSLVVPNLAMLRRSMIVIDPKGQLAAITARRRAQMGRVIILNPFGLFADELPHLHSNGWNPLLQLDPASPDFASDARCIAEAMGEKSVDGKGEFFETSMENLWTAFAMWERRTNGNEASLRNVLEQFARPTDELVATLKSMSESDSYAMRVVGGATYARLTNTNSQSTSLQDVIATIIKNTTFLTDDRIAADMWAGGAIDFAAMHKEITTIYVIVPVNQLRKQAKWLRMFVNVAMAELLKAPPRVATLPPVLFMLDEFGNLGRLPEILNVLNIARDLRIQLWMFLQNLEQLTASYKNESTYFFAGSGAVTTFSAQDAETAEYFSKMLGKREVALTSSSSNWSATNGGRGQQGANRSRTSSGGTASATHVFNLMDPDDLRRIGKGGTINWIEPGRFPVRGYAPGYWDKNYVGRLFGELDPNPYRHG